MKFLCGSCRTKYQISDEKVRGKILTIRCKKCGAKIMVRESLAREAAGGTALAPVAETAAGGMRAGGSASMAAAFDAQMRRSPEETPDDLPTSIAPVPGNIDQAGYEWYLAVDGQQHGPFAFAELVQKAKAGEISAAHHAWHDGMGDWKRVREIDDLAAYLPPASAPKAVPPPPPEAGPGADVLDFAAHARREAPDADLESTPPSTVPEPAVSASQEPASEPGASAFGAGISGDLLDGDDIFANVPRATDDELVKQESTRFFVQAAGVPKNEKRKRLGRLIGVGVTLALVAFVGLWAGGIIRVKLPFIGNPFARAAKTTAYEGDGSADAVDANVLLGEVDIAPKTKRRRRRAPSGGASNGRKLPTVGGNGLDVDLGDQIGEDGDSSGSARTPREGETSLEASLDGRPGLNLKRPEELTPLDMRDTELEIPPVDGGELDAATVRRVVTSRSGAVRRCFDRSLRSKENVSGKLVVEVEVQPTGRVSNVELMTPAFARTEVGSCLMKSIRKWRFPRFEGEAQAIELPFVLQKGT